jgi:hypothetical protein
MKLSQLYAILGTRFIPAVEAQVLLLGHEQPDYVYKNAGTAGTCKYNGPAVNHMGKTVGNPSKGCIIGQALQRLGWTDEVEMNKMCAISSLFLQLGIPERSLFLSLVQNAQDVGVPWGKAIEQIENT